MTKIGVASQYMITSLSDVSGLIVERDVPDEALIPYISLGLIVTPP